MTDFDSFINRDEFHFAAVMIPIIKKDGIPYILFEVRQSHLSQPGEICFPGGHVEKGESPLSAAIRETREELLISEEQVHDISPVGILITPSGLIVYAYCAKLLNYNGTFSSQETEEVFQVPLSFFLHTQPEAYHAKVTVTPDKNFPCHLLPGGRDYVWREGKYPVFFYQYEGHTIWGMTAKILREYILKMS